MVKPVAGVVDFLTTTMQGASKSAEFFNRDVIVRVRSPRAIFSDGTVMRFNARESEGVHICWALHNANTHVMSDYVYHAEIAQRILQNSSSKSDKGRQAVILTTTDIRCYEVDRLLLRAAVRRVFLTSGSCRIHSSHSIVIILLFFLRLIVHSADELLPFVEIEIAGLARSRCGGMCYSFALHAQEETSDHTDDSQLPVHCAIAVKFDWDFTIERSHC